MSKNIRELIVNFLQAGEKTAYTGEELLETLATPEISATKFWQELMELESNGDIMLTRTAAYGLPENLGFVSGRFQLTSKGFGFVIPDRKGERPDVFIPPRALNSAMNNDRVMARITSQVAGKKPEGEIIRIITRANNKVVGIFHQSDDFAFVTPDDRRVGQDIYVMRRNFNKAKDGQKVVVEITEWPQEHRKAEGKVTEVLGNIGDVGLEILSIIKQNDLPLTFPEEVIEASLSVPKTIKESELKGRRDLRHLPIVTVDGEDAKDLDDAVYVERLENGNYRLGVYIADVSYYVTEDSILDKEARERGTSVYLVDRVLPMLPERLSNGICSLNAGEDRLAMGCEMEINEQGETVDYSIFPAVIHVRHRLSYNIVRNMLAGDEELCQRYGDVLDMVQEMNTLRLMLHEKRHRRGSVDFDLPEQKVILDEKLHPIEIVQRIHGNAENLIEEFMLAANETVAQHMFKQQWPFVYRVHDVPAEDKMQELGKLLANFNVNFKASEETKPMEVQRAVAAMKGRPEERLVTTVALRCMRQAVYQTENIGHFGLAAEYYTHFTSPIRRYPDLIVHRMLRRWLANPKLEGKEYEPLSDKLEAIADHSSQRERAAAEAERATVELKKAEYMAEHIGEEYEGTISGVTNFGMFVELENGVEGLVHISCLTDDYYDFYEERYALIGEHSGKQYRLGDRVRIEVLQVNISEASIDFIMAGENQGVRDYLRQQLLAKQRERGLIEKASKAPSFKAAPKEAKSSKSKKKGGKGAKNKEPGRRSGAKETPPKAKKSRRSKKKK